MDTHEKLRALLAARGWTEYRLAKESKLSESTILNIFKRNATPSIPTLEAIRGTANRPLSHAEKRSPRRGE